MTKQNTLLKKVNQTGSMMIEALAMLTLISLVTPTLYKKSAERTTELQDINTATHVRTLMKAVDNYTTTNYQSILEKLDPNGADVVEINDLSDFLPYGYNFDAVKNFDKPIVTVKRQGESDSLTSFVIFPKTGDVNDLRAARIASMVGANGGYIDKDGNAKGVGGIWNLAADDVHEQLQHCAECESKVTDGSIIASSSESINAAARAGTENSKYLQRTKADEGEEWRNTMMTDLYMGGTKDILKGNEEISLSKILGVDQMIIGGITTDADANQVAADLVIKAHDGREGAAFIEGSLRALSNNFGVFTNDQGNPELNFANNLLKATNDQFSVNVMESDSPDLVIAKVDEAGARATFNVETKVDNTFETTGDTSLASGSSAKLSVGQNGQIMEASDATISMHGGKMILTQSQDEEGEDTSNLQITTKTANIESATTIGNGSIAPRVEDTNLNVQGNAFVSERLSVGDGTVEPLVADLDPKFDVQGNAFVSNKLEAGEIDAHKFDALELHAGGESYETEERWLNVDKDGIVVQDFSDPRENRLVVNNNEASIYGPVWTDSEGYQYKGGVMIGNSQINVSGGKVVDIRTQATGGNVRLQNGAIEAVGKAYTDGGNSVTSDTDQFLIKKGDTNLLNIVSGEHDTALNGDATAEIDPETFRIWAKTSEGNDINNRILEVNAATGDVNKTGNMSSTASVYIRRGAIELESSPTDEASYNADEGVGYIEASRLVANNLKSDGHTLVKPKYADRASNTYDNRTQIDRYMVNPAYTSVMHDIKLTTRGGARLSDILPDFINKGIYIVNNTYEDGVNFNNLNVVNDGGKIKANNATEIQESNTFKKWASPFLGVIPAPQCPPGHAKVITLAPASFQMSQTGDMVLNSDGRYYVQENAKANELQGVNLDAVPASPSGDKVVTSAQYQKYEIVKSFNNGTAENGYIYYLGLANEPSVTRSGNPYTPKPLFFQQSTWLKSKVVAYGEGGKCSGNASGCQNFLGWAAVMGFIYPYELYRPIIDDLQGYEGAQDQLANQQVYWNVFPVRPRSIEAYATVYCYFDRTNIFGSGNDPQYVDQYDQLYNFRNVYKKLDANTTNGTVPGKNTDYIQRLNDPQLNYNDPW